jgi:hypothetical protein
MVSPKEATTGSESGMIDGLVARNGRVIPVIVGGISGGMMYRSDGRAGERHEGSKVGLEDGVLFGCSDSLSDSL